MSDKDRLLKLRERAEKAVELIEMWDDLFPNNKREHLIVSIMAAIDDAYRQGLMDASKKKK